jgi:hypothetical protein
MKDQALATLKEQTRFYLSTPERAAEALLFVRNLERFAAELKEKVKERAVEIMDKENVETLPYRLVDPDTGEVREWIVRRDYAKESKEYRPENVYDALGEDCFSFMKVEKVKLEKYLVAQSAQGKLSMEAVTLATKDPKIKTIKGSGVKITEVKAEKR